jgi:hypothetical protein
VLEARGLYPIFWVRAIAVVRSLEDAEEELRLMNLLREVLEQGVGNSYPPDAPRADVKI